MRSLKKRGPHVLYDLNDLLFSLHIARHTCPFCPFPGEQNNIVPLAHIVADFLAHKS